MKVLLAQINTTVGDIEGNVKLIRKALNEGKKLKSSLVIFPELTLCGYPPKDLCLFPHFVSQAEKALLQIIEETSGISVIVGTIRYHHQKGEKQLCNSAAIIENGKLLGYQDKMLLPTYDVFDERRYFEPAKETKLWKINGKNVGVTICEDIWQHSETLKETSYLNDPVELLKPLRPDFVVNLSASPYSTSKLEKRFNTCSKAAKTMNAPLLLCNLVGGNDGLIFDGSSLFMNSEGELVDHALSFSEDYFLADLSSINGIKSYSAKSQDDRCEELFLALTLGLKDYFVKSKFEKACLGLSGGIDSCLVACIAVEALGKENVLGVLMPSRYSSKNSITNALQLAKSLDIQTKEISIESPFQSYLDLLSPIFEEEMGIAKENIQARIRGMLLMAISNQLGYIVLSTGNKSELAMGYCTLYGDLCGGLAVISDITKNEVYALSNWINREKEIIPKNAIEKPPSAELKDNQKDSDSLPDYAIVDKVVKAYVEEQMSAEEISKEFGFSLELVMSLIKKIHQNEYKRYQSSLGLRVSEKAFSIGRSFPIVHGLEC